MGSFVFMKGDPSNNKFYVILSGQVGIVIPRKKIEEPIRALKHQTQKDLNEIGSSRKTPIGDAQETLAKANKGSTGNSMAGSLSYLDPKTANNEHSNPQSRKLSRDSGVDDLINKKKKDENSNELSDNDKFEEFASQFGDLIRVIGDGESFGELALKNNIPRSASILCKTNCEFLVITKAQFDRMFLRKEREKEEFLRDTFPFLRTVPVSSKKFVDVLYCFKVIYHQLLTLNKKID